MVVANEAKGLVRIPSMFESRAFDGSGTAVNAADDVQVVHSAGIRLLPGTEVPGSDRVALQLVIVAESAQIVVGILDGGEGGTANRRHEALIAAFVEVVNLIVFLADRVNEELFVDFVI